MKITVDTLARTDLQTAWTTYSNPDDITRWNNASPDWHSPRCEVDLREGGRFNTRMEAKTAAWASISRAPTPRWCRSS